MDQLTQSSTKDVSIDIGDARPRPVQVVFEAVSIDVVDKSAKQPKLPCLRKGPPPTKRILDQVSGIFGPAELIACMGPSGSGKTTLLNALTGVTKPTGGNITANGRAFDAAAMRRVSALVPQDDLLTPSLTVEEALMEGMLFKTALGPAQRQERVELLLQQFGLGGSRAVPIGHPEGEKGISGGQKRRLSVALELCGSPSLLYLDEPTSGLDAVSTMTLVKLLATLARGGVTVIATIHQPSAAAFFTFDRLLLLHQGATCYQGPVRQGAQPVGFFEAAGFACPPLDNPADFFFEVLMESAAAIRQKYEAEGVAEDKGRAADVALAPLRRGSASADSDEAMRASRWAYPSSLRTQLRTHLRRNVRAMVRDPLLARLRVGSSISIGLALGILYYDMPNDSTGINERITLLLFSMLFLSIANALPVVIAILPELAVVRKEARNNWYSPVAYTPAKLLVETPLLVLPPLIFLAIMANMSNLNDGDAGRFFMLYLAIELVVNCTHAWALFLCSIAPSVGVGVLLAPGSIMPMAVLSGFFVNQQDMSWVFRWFSYIDYLNYGWQAMATAGFHGQTFDAPLGLQTGEEVLENRLRLPSTNLKGYWTNVGILLGFMLCFRALATIMISRRLIR